MGEQHHRRHADLQNARHREQIDWLHAVDVHSAPWPVDWMHLPTQQVLIAVAAVVVVVAAVVATALHAAVAAIA